MPTSTQRSTRPAIRSTALADPLPPNPDDIEKGNAGARREMWRLTGTFSFIGIEFGVAALLGFFAGSWLDGKLGTAPWLTLTLMLLGFAAATRDLFRLVKKHRAQLANEDRERGGDDVGES